MSEDGYREAQARIAHAREEGSEVLDLNRLSLSKLPPEITKLTTLRRVEFSENLLGEFPPELAELKSLEAMDISNNQLACLPSWIAQLSSLRVLYLSYNKFSCIPPPITKLSNLETLSFSGNQLPKIPPEIEELTKLTALYVAENNISQLPHEIGKLSLQEIDLSGNDFTNIPQQIMNIDSLHILSLRNNGLGFVEDNIGVFQSLKGLDLASNQIFRISSEIKHLAALQHLNLDNNRLLFLPFEFRNLLRMERLYIRDNVFPSLPIEVTSLTELRRLYVDQNRILDLPVEISQLRKLQILSLAKNRITKLPPEIGHLTALERLDLGGNLLSDLPKRLGDMQNLVAAANVDREPRTAGLFLEGNPLPPPYPRLIAPGQPDATRNVLAWLRGELDPASLPPTPDAGDADPPPTLPPPNRHLHVEVGPDGQIDFAPPEALDADGNNLRQLRRLHPSLLDLARELLGSMPRDNTQHPLLQRRCEAYLALIDKPLAEMDFGRLYHEGIRLDRARQRDSELVASRELAPLPADASEALDSLLDAHAAFIMATAVGAEALPDQAEYDATPTERRLRREEAEAATRAILDEDGIRISPRLRDAAEAAAEGMEQGSNPIRSGAAGNTLLRSLTAAVLASAACGTPALIGFLAIGTPGTIIGGAAALPVFKSLENTKVFQAARAYFTSQFDKLTEPEARQLLAALASASAAVQRIDPVLRRLSARTGFGWITPWLDRMKAPPKDGT